MGERSRIPPDKERISSQEVYKKETKQYKLLTPE